MDMKVTKTQADAKIAFLASNLKPGEHYAGILLGKNGEPNQHLVVVAITKAEGDWKKQTAWATSIGAELPTRRELNLLRANLRELFASTWYWSCETYEGNSAYAWYQDFTDGYQFYGHKSAALRAVAVRRFPL
ncbi:MAG: DUF1566 domain-containing protein [Betaproteobacteria bacterium]|nr:DUF1566 domain-containing protein [Betaproteobacteria bacterium]